MNVWQSLVTVWSLLWQLNSLKNIVDRYKQSNDYVSKLKKKTVLHTTLFETTCEIK